MGGQGKGTHEAMWLALPVSRNMPSGADKTSTYSVEQLATHVACQALTNSHLPLPVTNISRKGTHILYIDRATECLPDSDIVLDRCGFPRALKVKHAQLW